MRNGDILLGPGKADLLDAIRRTGSIRVAASSLGMSYMRAWELIRAMNEGFAKPVVATVRGGSARGGASLTKNGGVLLALYREMERASLDAASPAWRRMRRYLRG